MERGTIENTPQFRSPEEEIQFLRAQLAEKEKKSEGVSDNTLRQKSIELGMVTLLEGGFSKVKQGITSIDEVLSVCPSPES